MSELIFKYGVMGCSKSAQALMTKFNYEERGMSTILYKPSIDTRSEEVSSRIGISSKCISISPTDRLYNCIANIIIVDEAQFLSVMQIEDLRKMVDRFDIPVYCFGLRTDFCGKLFDGSKRLMEIADSIEEIPSMCSCGNKAIISAKIINDKIVTHGEQIEIGGNEKYKPMCYRCWKEKQWD